MKSSPSQLPDFTTRIVRDGEWFVASSPEFPEGNGQGRTEAGALESLRDSIALLIEDTRASALRHEIVSSNRPVDCE